MSDRAEPEDEQSSSVPVEPVPVKPAPPVRPRVDPEDWRSGSDDDDRHSRDRPPHW